MNKTEKFAVQEAYDKGFLDGITANKGNDVNWEEQNKMREQWLRDNPNAEYIGWTSI